MKVVGLARRRRVTAIAIALATLTALSACGSDDEGSDSGSAAAGEQQQVTLRLGSLFAENHPIIAVGAKHLAEEMESRTDGKVTIQLFPNSQLGANAEMDAALLDGSLDMRLDAPPEGQMPALSVLYAPYLFESDEDMERVLRGPVAQEKIWDPMNEQLDITWLDTWIYGEYPFTSNKKFTNRDELEGIRVRVPPIDSWIDLLDAMGADTFPAPFAELYTSLQTGVYDAQYNPVSVIDAAKLYEVQKYFMPHGILHGNANVVISDRALAKLTPENQKLIKELATEAGDLSNEATLAATDESVQRFLDAGMELVELDEESFRASIEEEFLPKYKEIYGADVYDALQEAGRNG